jgi:hypothetical protein
LPRPAPSLQEAQRLLDASIAPIEKLGWSAVVAMGSFTAAAFAGWFGSDGALERNLAGWLIYWFGMATLFCFGSTVLISMGRSQDAPAPTRLWLSLKIALLALAINGLGWVAYNTVVGAVVILFTAAKQDFRPDLRPSDYAIAVSQLVEPAGASLTAFRLAPLGRPGKVSEGLLMEPPPNCLASSPGVPIQDDKTLEGRLFPLATGELAVVPADGSTTTIRLFGITLRDGDAAFATAQMAQVIESLNPDDRAGDDSMFRCVRPPFANGKWICTRRPTLERGATDLGLSLLRRGGAILDTRSVIGTPVQEAYLAESFLAQSNACGIWSRT